MEHPALPAPLVNGLGMKFRPISGASVNGVTMYLCLHHTRKGDYRAFAEANLSLELDPSWQHVVFDGVEVSPGEDHPVVMVSWNDAVAFCAWLSRREGRKYRLPTDHEWSCAAGIGDFENPFTSPWNKNDQIPGIYPWGSVWPPLKGTGSFADGPLRKRVSYPVILGYHEPYATTTPVMQYEPNAQGFFDLAGNISQWCQDWYDESHRERVLRGGAWKGDDPVVLLASHRISASPEERGSLSGFRIVLEGE